MTHLTEEELIGYRDGEQKGHEQIANHLKECSECREELARIESVFTALSAMPEPDPGENFEQRMWQQIVPRLPEKSAKWWEGFFAPRRLTTIAALAAAVALAFFAGRITKRTEPNTVAMDASKVRERVLIVAVGEHLDRSEMVLMELENAAPVDQGKNTVNISSTQQRAQDLLEENRLYRQTALKQGDQAMASTLDELERVLLDIANSPDSVTSAQFESLRKRIEDRGILFKVRVVNQDLRERSKPANSRPVQNENTVTKRNKI
jgi:hypothetical protein